MRLALGVVVGMLLLRLICPELFSGLRGLLVDRQGEEAARTVFQAFSEGQGLPGGAVRVFEEDGP